MKTRHETRRGGQPSPHSVLNYARRGKSGKYEIFIKTFLKRDQDGLN